MNSWFCSLNNFDFMISTSLVDFDWNIVKWCINIYFVGKHFLLQLKSVEKQSLTFIQEIFYEINSIMFYCFHRIMVKTVIKAQCENIKTLLLLSKKNSSNHIFRNFFSKNVAFTKFLPKSVRCMIENFHNFHTISILTSQCGNLIIFPQQFFAKIPSN